MLQFITNTQCQRSVEDQVAAVLRGGCKWIQLRMKEADDHEVRRTVEKIKPLCARHEAFLLLNDRVELCKELELTGVHVGREDMPPSKARLLLGPAAVIGVTANTFADIEAVRSLDIDYIGMGPYADTQTKANLAPILGLEGIAELCRRMEEQEIEIARVAVGGIALADVAPLMKAGVNGVAVSGAIAAAEDPERMTRLFIEELHKFQPGAIG